MSTVFTSTVYHTLKRVLSGIVDDKRDGYESRAIFKKYMVVKTMEDQYEDALEMGGPTLLSEKPEGNEMELRSIREGVVTRYIARTVAGRLTVTEEALKDSKYPQAIAAARRLKKAGWKTLDFDAARVLIRAFDTSYPGADGQPLVSASHTLPGGGTFSNQLSPALAPSVTALSEARILARKFPGHDGVVGEMIDIKKIVCPIEQEDDWYEILGSKKHPGAGEFNRTNVATTMMGLGTDSVVANVFWDTTETAWLAITDAEDGLQFRWRERPSSRTWVENSQMQMNYGWSCRIDNGWSEPRGVVGSNP